jgi:hypothetical protein
MGQLIYGALALTVNMDDLTLLHLQVAMGAKLRHHESFFLSWSRGPNEGDGRSTVWISGGIPLVFAYETRTPTVIDRSWVEKLVAEASNRGSIDLDDHKPTTENPSDQRAGVKAASAPRRRARPGG